jgi:hypothetical protein
MPDEKEEDDDGGIQLNVESEEDSELQKLIEAEKDLTDTGEAQVLCVFVCMYFMHACVCKYICVY